MDKTIYVEHDVNFLENSLWKTDLRDKRDEFIIEFKNGGRYEYKAIDGIPDDIDAVFLYYFLLASQKENWAIEMAFRPSIVLKELNMPVNSQYYKRLETSLKRWHGVRAVYTNSFFTKQKNKEGVLVKAHVTKRFNIFKSESIVIENKKRKSHYFRIIWDSEFLNASKESVYKKNINLKTFVSLRYPIARRLYEWLPKQFIAQEELNIYHGRLFEKLRILNAKYPSEVERKLQTIQKNIKRLNEQDFKYIYKMKYTKFDKKNKKLPILITFTRQPKVDLVNFDNEIVKQLKVIGLKNKDIDSILEKHKQNVIEQVLDNYNSLPDEKLREIENPAGYFLAMLPSSGEECLPNKASLKKKEAEKQQIIKKEKEEDKKILKKLQKSFEVFKDDKRKDALKKLSDSENEALKKEFLDNTSNFIKNFYAKKGFNCMPVKASYNVFLNEKFMKPEELDFVKYAKSKGYEVKENCYKNGYEIVDG